MRYTVVVVSRNEFVIPLPLHWLGGTVQNVFRYVFTEKIVSLYACKVNSFPAFFVIFFVFLRGRRSHFRLERGDEQVAGDDAVLGGKAVFKIRGIEKLGVRRELVVALPDDQPQAVFVQKAELKRRVAVL